MTAATTTPTLTRPTTAIRRADGPDLAYLTIGIDVGGTKTACVVTDAADEVLYREVVATDASRLAEQIVELARRAIADVEHAGSSSTGHVAGRVAAIGVAAPGQVEPRSGALDLAVNLGGVDIDLGSTVTAETGLPCFVEHDARAAATWVYERTDTGERDGADLCYLSLGTGIAAGIVLDGRTLRGETGLAGEIGHAFAEPNGPQCACGLAGCLETVAAGPAIARMAREAVAAGRQTTLRADSTAADVFQASAAGDEVAVEIATRVGTHLARAIRGLVLTLGVRRVVIGGGVAASGAALLAPILDAIAAERRVSRLVETAFAETTVDMLEPGLEPGARGAASIARRSLLGARIPETRKSAAHGEEVGDR
jgi:glucokinase